MVEEMNFRLYGRAFINDATFVLYFLFPFVIVGM